MLKSKISKLAVVASVLLLGALSASAQTDASAMVTSVNLAFVGVAGACVTIGTFFLVYRLVKRVK